ncbi:RING-H2 finger protein ATL56-like [Melia azedarach]|uniref:RING-H2 finger protein ATL56-like n=1 Tax=Melia azedarach TaxID=155640 RepID=A0ACC1YZM2_MELAZ|nr:RING-H2 finger protein ATL56-like [Melia azedarach]
MAIVISVLLLFVGVGALIFIHVCIVARAFRRGFANGGAMVERSSNGSTSMSRDEVEKLPCYEYIAKSKGSSPVECAVCLDNFKKGEKCRLLPICNHSFHAQCVDAWILKNPNCPICRTAADSRRFGEESSRFSDIQMESTENQASESIESNDVRIEVAVGEVVTESRQNQTNVVETQLGSNPDSRLENF